MYLVSSLLGCSYPMRITNQDSYSSNARATSPLTLRIVDGAPGSPTELFQAAYEGLKGHPDVAEVVLQDLEPAKHVDATITLRTAVTYEGSGSNFFITFPGFLLFTHAWNGFVYKANVTTRVDVVLDGREDKIARQFDMNYDLRYCDYDRGIATSSGWYIPGWGISNILIGFAMMSYDSDASPEFLQKVRPGYGWYIANSVIAMIANPATARPGRFEDNACAPPPFLPG